MEIDGKNAERIAKDLIREIASEWVDTPKARCLEEDGSYRFEFIVEPETLIRRTRTVERPSSPSTVRFDPLAEASEIVTSCSSVAEIISKGDAELIEPLTRLNAKPQIRQMLLSAPSIFADAIWQARVIGETLHVLQQMQFVGRPDIARGVLNSAMVIMEKRLRSHLGRIHQKQKPKISESILMQTLLAFFPRFKESGLIPSQRQFAKTLGVTAKGWRTYLTTHRLGEHDVYVKQRLEEMLTLDTKK